MHVPRALLIDDRAHHVGQIGEAAVRQQPQLLAVARSAQDRALHGQLDGVVTELAERKLIERARGVLMDECGLHEEQACRRQRKQAMDRGQRLAQVAQRIVDARELLRSTR